MIKRLIIRSSGDVSISGVKLEERTRKSLVIQKLSKQDRISKLFW